MNPVSWNKKIELPRIQLWPVLKAPVPLRTQSLAAGACICGIVTMTMDCDVREILVIMKNKAGDFPRTEKVSLPI